MKKLAFILIPMVVFAVLFSVTGKLEARRYSQRGSTFSDYEEGSGRMVTEKRDVKGFIRIESYIGADISVEVGPAQSVSVTFDDNLMEYVKTEVHGQTLEIRSDHSFSTDRNCKIEIQVPKLEEVDVSGSGDLEVTNLKGDNFSLELSGAYNVRADGKVDDLDVAVSGTGSVDLKELVASSASVSISGAGKVKVHADDSFSGSISGVGSINYYGDPERVRRDVSGIGHISHK